VVIIAIPFLMCTLQVWHDWQAKAMFDDALFVVV
jgi:hypothetical protein